MCGPFMWPTRRFQVRIEKRRQKLYAVMPVPRPLRKVVGKDRFVQSLQTSDQRTAERRAAVLRLQWLNDLEKARKGTSDHIAKDAEWWRKVLKDAPDEHQRGL